MHTKYIKPEDVPALFLNIDRHFIICSATQFTAGFLFVCAAPLLEEKRNSFFLALLFICRQRSRKGA